MTQLRLVRESNLNRASCERIAEAYAKETGYTPEVSLRDYLQKLGVRLLRRSVWDEDVTSMRAYSKGDVEIIYTDVDMCPLDEVARNLGHYVLHYLWPLHQGEDVPPSRAMRYKAASQSARVVTEGIWFGAAFTMPEDTFRADWNETQSVSQLSLKYHVGVFDINCRLMRLGLKEWKEWRP